MILSIHIQSVLVIYIPIRALCYLLSTFYDLGQSNVSIYFYSDIKYYKYKLNNIKNPLIKLSPASSQPDNQYQKEPTRSKPTTNNDKLKLRTQR